PVPPCQAHELSGRFRCKTRADYPRRHSPNHRIGCNIAGNHGIRPNHGTVADRHTRHDDRTVAYPDIISAGDGLLHAAPAEVRVKLLKAEILIRPIAHLMGGDAFHRVLERIDADVSGYRTELADGGVYPFG